jgi:hypothetical protein
MNFTLTLVAMKAKLLGRYSALSGQGRILALVVLFGHI